MRESDKALHKDERSHVPRYDNKGYVISFAVVVELLEPRVQMNVWEAIKLGYNMRRRARTKTYSSSGPPCIPRNYGPWPKRSPAFPGTHPYNNQSAEPALTERRLHAYLKVVDPSRILSFSTRLFAWP